MTHRITCNIVFILKLSSLYEFMKMSSTICLGLFGHNHVLTFLLSGKWCAPLVSFLSCPVCTGVSLRDGPMSLCYLCCGLFVSNISFWYIYIYIYSWLLSQIVINRNFPLYIPLFQYTTLCFPSWFVVNGDLQLSWIDNTEFSWIPQLFTP
jgi:hypothetical protein